MVGKNEHLVSKVENLYKQAAAAKGKIALVEKEIIEQGCVIQGFSLTYSKKDRSWRAARRVEGKYENIYLGTLENVSGKILDWKAKRKLQACADIEELFDVLDWERKFEHSVPDTDILAVFRETDLKKAIDFFVRKKEETDALVRAVFLGCDSRGQLLAVTEEDKDF